MHKKVLSPIALALVTLALVGCGGGGGGGGGGGFMLPITGATAPADTSSGTGTTGNTGDTGNTGSAGNTGSTDNTGNAAGGGSDEPTGSDSTLVTTVKPHTYAIGSEELAAFTLLNAERLRCGFGVLQQSTQLDAAAAGHANYLLRNNVAGHFQSSSDPFYTGASARDRANAAGYSPALVFDDNSDFQGGMANVVTGRGVEGIRNLLSAPYHAHSLLYPALDIGISIMSSDMTGTTGVNPRTIAQFNLGFAAGTYSQKASGASVQTYPCEGTVGTAYELRNETPNPIPGRDLSVNPIGQPIMVSVRPGYGIAITSASMRERVSGIVVTLRPAMVKANDPNASLDPSQAVLMPDAPLLPNTEYEVSIAGNNTVLSWNGTDWVSTGTNPLITDNTTGAFTKTFNFTTGS